jgi:hypothetical protein
MLHKTSLTTLLTFCNRGVSRFRQPASALFLIALMSVNSSFLLNAGPTQSSLSTTTLTIKIIPQTTGCGSYATVSGTVTPSVLGDLIILTTSIGDTFAPFKLGGTTVVQTPHGPEFSNSFSGTIPLRPLLVGMNLATGSYTVTAHYRGNLFATSRTWYIVPSDSAPVTVKPPCLAGGPIPPST